MIVVTWLELTDPAQLRPARDPGVTGAEISRVDPPDGAVSRWYYVEVGRPHAWTDHLSFDDAAWDAWAREVETWALTVQGRRAGFYELRPEGDGVEVAYFGLLPAFQGRGLGGWLLDARAAPWPRARAADLGAHGDARRPRRPAELPRAGPAGVPPRPGVAGSARGTLRFLSSKNRRPEQHTPGSTRRLPDPWPRPSASTSARRTRAWPSSRAASRPSSRTPRAGARPRPSSPSRRAASASSAPSPSARRSPTRRTRSSRSSASWAARRPRCARRSRSSPTRSSPARTATRASRRAASSTRRRRSAR